MMPAAASVAHPARAVQALICLQGQLLMCAAGLHVYRLPRLLNWVYAERQMHRLATTEAVAAAHTEEESPMHAAAAAMGQVDLTLGGFQARHLPVTAAEGLGSPPAAAAAQGQADWTIQLSPDVRTKAHRREVSFLHHWHRRLHAQAGVVAAWECGYPVSVHRRAAAEARYLQLCAGLAVALLADWPGWQLHGSDPWKLSLPCAAARLLLSRGCSYGVRQLKRGHVCWPGR